MEYFWVLIKPNDDISTWTFFKFDDTKSKSWSRFGESFTKSELIELYNPISIQPILMPNDKDWELVDFKMLGGKTMLLDVAPKVNGEEFDFKFGIKHRSFWRVDSNNISKATDWEEQKPLWERSV